MERALYLTKYRNMGLTEPQRLVLNNFTDKSKMGNLVILIGANNAGKSNVLDALESFGKKRIFERDVTDFSYEPQDQKPQISLSCKGVEEEYTYRIELGKESNPFLVYPQAEQERFIIDKSGLEELRDNVNDLYGLLKNYVSYHDACLAKITSLYQSLTQDINRADALMESDFDRIDSSVAKTINHFSNFCQQGSLYEQIWNEFSNAEKHNRFVSVSHKRCSTKEERMNRLLCDKYGVNFLPSIIRYIDQPIGKEQIVTDKARIKGNAFFGSVFQAIDYSLDTLMNVYTRFSKENNKGILSIQENEINKRLKNVSDDFNRLYCFDETPYQFKISLESNNIYFYINEGNKSVTLDYQSVGFRWFFNLYFNLLSSKKLLAGDIIIMDEPATNLHVMGQKELRKFLKQFAIKNGITIVLATHSPFLIDIDYLDELRVVETHEGEAFIKNDFSAIDLNDPDSLMPVKRALTVESCHLYDPDKTVVFVEGITDYNYLLAFKKILDIQEDIIFLPIKGVGKENNERKQKAISKRLIGLRKHNPILLVDSDPAGLSIQKLNAKDSALKVLALSDIDPNFKTIESLFSKNDLERNGLINKEKKLIKHASTSANLKTFYGNHNFSQSTKSNFRKVFEKLKEITE